MGRGTGKGKSGSEEDVIDASDRHLASRNVMFSFLMMTLCFAINHGTVTAVIPLATAQFDSNLGNDSLGALYFFYTLTALLGSTMIVGELGQKWGLVAGCGVYTVYVVGNLLGVLTHDGLRWVVVMASSCFGGVAAGFLWTAQGGYFAAAAKLYAKEKGIAQASATSHLGGVFAFVYLAFELVCKLLSSLVLVWVCGDHWHGDILTGQCGVDEGDNSGVISLTLGINGTIPTMSPESDKSAFIKNLKFHGVIWTYGVFATLAVVSSIGMTFIKQLEPLVGLLEKKEETTMNEDIPAPTATMFKKIFAAVQLIYDEPKILLLGLFNVQFGFTAAYLNSYVTGTVIKDSLGKDKVGYFVAIIPLTASLMQFPFTRLTKLLSTKTPVMLIGMCCFLGFGSAFYFTDYTMSSDTTLAEKLGKWGILAPLFFVFGCGRAVWEGQNKAVYADMFKATPEAAFANLILQLGTTSTLGFLFFHLMSAKLRESILVFSGLFAIIGYLACMRIDGKQKKEHKGSYSLETVAS